MLKKQFTFRKNALINFLRLSAFLMGIIILSDNHLYGQYVSDPSINTPITDNYTLIASAVSSEGKLHCLFNKNNQLTLQIFDTDGNKLLNNNGVVVASNIGNTQIQVSTAGVIYIISDNEVTEDISLYKISSTGSNLGTLSFSGGFVPKLTLLEENKLIVTFLDQDFTNTTYVLLTDHGTNFTQDWSFSNALQNEQIIQKSDKNLYTVSYERLQVPPYVYIHVNSIDIETGSLQWNDWVKCSEIEAFGLYNSPVETIIDNNDDLYVIKSYAGTQGHFGAIQKITSAGQKLWGNNGLNLLNPLPNASTFSIQAVYNEADDEIKTIISAENSNLHGYIYLQTIKTDGTINNPAGVPLLTESSIDGEYVIDAHYCGSEIVFSHVEYPNNNIFISKINNNGEFMWSEQFKEINTTGEFKFTLANKFDRIVNDKIIIVFGEDRNQNSTIEGYAQMIDCAGSYATIDELEEKDFTVYPNPTKGELKIRTALDDNNLTYQIVDINGRTIHFELEKSYQETKINFSGSEGLYFLKIQNSKGRELMYKISKQ